MKVVYGRGKHELGVIQTSFLGSILLCIKLMLMGWNIKLKT